MRRIGKPAVAIAIMGVIIAVLITLCTPRSTSRSSGLSEATPAGRDGDPSRPHVRVLVLDYDPTIPDSGGARAHVAFGWAAPQVLAQGYIADVREASGGRMPYRVVEWRTLDEFPAKRD